MPEVPKKVVSEEKVHIEAPKKPEPPPRKGTRSILVKLHRNVNVSQNIIFLKFVLSSFFNILIFINVTDCIVFICD